ncbi:MAG: putative beta-lysine N-acetyltransferase [Candidatus Omnitrophica bacterium]|nr:putative beta-lysine N-acetyltransferase [Candidatus Omnitrophota bacterium]
MEWDKIEVFGKSKVQHGKLSDRVYLMKLNEEDMPGIIKMLECLVKDNAYSKIFAKVPEKRRHDFENFEFQQEAHIPNFFKGREDGFFMSKFFNGRDVLSSPQKIDAIIQLAKEKSGTAHFFKEDFKYEIRKAIPEDVGQMCSVFKKVFDSYPFPIFDPEYISSTMSDNIDYYVACEKGQIISISSAEIDKEQKNAEMTDFATLPPYRSQGIAQRLLQNMEKNLVVKGVLVAYTIARALSAGMNITFAKHHYQFGGTLVNNTNISGKIESMNVWYKLL